MRLRPVFTASAALFLTAAGFSAVQAAPFIVNGTATAFTGPEQNQSGFPPPQNTYRAIDTANNLAFGAAATIVSGGTIPGHPTIHNPIFLTDGNYGNGRSWIPNSGTATISLNLGGVADIGEIKFGRDRLGYFNDRKPGSVTVELAGANGIFQTVLLNQAISAPMTSAAGYTLSIRGFDPNLTQYVRLTLTTAPANSAFALDEIEIFAAPTPGTVALIGFGLLGLGLLRRRAAV